MLAFISTINPTGSVLPSGWFIIISSYFCNFLAIFLSIPVYSAELISFLTKDSKSGILAAAKRSFFKGTLLVAKDC